VATHSKVIGWQHENKIFKIGSDNNFFIIECLLSVKLYLHHYFKKWLSFEHTVRLKTKPQQNNNKKTPNLNKTQRNKTVVILL